MTLPLPEIRVSNSLSRKPALDLSLSSNLYLTDEQGRWFEEVMEDKEYKQKVSNALTTGENAWLQLLSKTKLSSKHSRITVIDCGPADPQESIRKLTKLMRAVTVGQYIVVDMNDHLLERIRSTVSGALGIPSRFVKSRFEELHQADWGDATSGDTLLLFGSTEMNYEADELRGVLSNFCTPGMLLAFEGLLRIDGGSPAGYESRAVEQFAFGPLWLLGATLEQFTFHPVFIEDRIILEFIAKEPITFSVAGYPSLQKDDAVWTAFSRRPTIDQHKLNFELTADALGTIVSDGKIASSLGRFR